MLPEIIMFDRAMDISRCTVFLNIQDIDAFATLTGRGLSTWFL